LKTDARKARDSKYRISPEERDWRVFRGDSPNPWGVVDSWTFPKMEIITERKPSRLERRSWARET